MGAGQMLFLFGLGVVYAIAYAVFRNVVVLWPLLIPMGLFYNNLHSGGIVMPWAAILGFLDILALMATAIWLAGRHQKRWLRGDTVMASAASSGAAGADVAADQAGAASKVQPVPT
jgi:hypothetical protein